MSSTTCMKYLAGFGRRMKKTNLTVFLLSGMFTVWILIYISNEFNQISKQTEHREPLRGKGVGKPDVSRPTWYAVFTASTPNGESHRSYDYAFYLPLTALAWERIGFKSLVVITGSRCEWTNDPALRLILSRLEVDRKAIVIFMETPLENRMMIGQTIRIFAPNLADFPAKDGDYLITADADQWPLRREHFIPRLDHDLILVHSTNCCDPFTVPWRPNKVFVMYSMMNIGASVATWRQLMNDGRRTIANDTESIFKYYEEEGFGSGLRQKVEFASNEWFADQMMVSIRIDEWMQRHGNGSPPVYRVSDDGFKVTHRNDWDGDIIDDAEFQRRSDAHMLLKPFLTEEWEWIQPMMSQMYGGNQSVLYKWCQDYFDEFRKQIKYYLHFSVVDYDKQV